MASGIDVVQRVENDIEALEPVDVEARIFNVGMVCFKLDSSIELCSGVSRNLYISNSVC
jgi:hypothetical protein